MESFTGCLSEVAFLQGQTMETATLARRNFVSRRFLFLRLDTSSFAEAVRAGDHVAVLPQNSPFEVLRVLLGLRCGGASRPRQVVLAGREAVATSQQLFTELLDIARPLTRETLARIEPAVADAAERAAIGKLLADDDDEVFREWQIGRHRVSDVFSLFPSARIDFNVFVDLLEPIRPRWFDCT